MLFERSVAFFKQSDNELNTKFNRSKVAKDTVHFDGYRVWRAPNSISVYHGARTQPRSPTPTPFRKMSRSRNYVSVDYYTAQLLNRRRRTLFSIIPFVQAVLEKNEKNYFWHVGRPMYSDKVIGRDAHTFVSLRLFRFCFVKTVIFFNSPPPLPPYKSNRFR